MAPFANLSREERLGLLVAGAAHVALVAALLLQDQNHEAIPPSERITVSLATDVSLDSTAPDPSANPAAAMAPVISDLPEPAPVPMPEVAPPKPLPEQPRPTQAARPRPTPAPTPTRQATRPNPAPTPTRQVARPTPTPAPRPTQTNSIRPVPAPTATRPATGSRFNDAFTEGLSDATGDSGNPGDRPSAQQQASIDAAIIRQLKPHWVPPSGVDVDRLVTVVRFRLNRDGSLNGAPEVIRQTGVTDSNRAQAGRHQEQAIRAVRLAAPFNLPDRFYSGWSVVTTIFDNRLAQ